MSVRHNREEFEVFISKYRKFCEYKTSAYEFHLMTLHVQQLFIYYFHSLFIYYLFCWLFTTIFTLLEGEEMMAGEDVKLLQEKITGK